MCPFVLRRSVELVVYLHWLFSRPVIKMTMIAGNTEFMMNAGTRGPMDMVEIPSHFFEYFLQSKECLALCCRHYATGEAMPKKLETSVQLYWSFMPALEMNDTVCITPLLRLHSLQQ